MNGPPGPDPGQSIDWEFAPEWSGGILSARARHKARVVGRISHFWGAVYLRDDGIFAGLSINLRLCGPLRRDPARPPARADRLVLWEASELEHTGDRDFTGRCVLRTDKRKIFTDLAGTLVPATSASSGRPYMKIMISTEFRGLQLNWPSARYAFQLIELRFFTEIRQRVAAG